MSDANQVRINELARELEVKAKAIIDLLAGYGVTEKKTHSSSIPADVAEKVRKHLQGVADAKPAAPAAPPPAAPAVAAPPASTTTPAAKPAPSVPPVTTPIRPAAPTARPAAPAASTHTGGPAQRPAA